MNDQGKSKEQLISELKELREELAFFKTLGAENISILRVLQDFKEIYENFYKSNPHPMWIYDPETFAFLDVNDAAVQRYGYSEEEFISMTIKIFARLRIFRHSLKISQRLRKGLI